MPWRLYSWSRCVVGVGAGNRGEIRSGIADRLNTGFLVIGEDGDFAPAVTVRGSCAVHLDLTINAKHFCHFWLEIGVALLHVIADFVRLDLMRCQDLAHRSLGEFRQAGMTSLRPVITRMRGQQTGRPQLVRIPGCDRLRASQRDQPRPRFPCNYSIASGSRPVIERCQDPQFRGSLKAPCHGLLAHPNLPRDHVSRWGVEVGNDHTSSLHPARRLRPRARNIDQRTAPIRINRKRNDASRSNHRFPLRCPPTTYHISRTLHTILQHIDILESFY